MNIFWLDLLFLNCNLVRIILLLLILFQNILSTLSLSFKFISCIYDSWILPSTMIYCYMYVQPIDVFLPVGLNTTFPVPSFPQWPLVCGVGLWLCEFFSVYYSMFIGGVLITHRTWVIMSLLLYVDIFYHY